MLYYNSLDQFRTKTIYVNEKNVTCKDHFEWHSVLLQKQGLQFLFFSLLYSSLEVSGFFWFPSVKTLMQIEELGFLF